MARAGSRLSESGTPAAFELLDTLAGPFDPGGGALVRLPFPPPHVTGRIPILLRRLQLLAHFSHTLVRMLVPPVGKLQCFLRGGLRGLSVR